ncbi:MAG: LD-carboxypeptidase [Nanoarchaeota archaeon]|nr:LD-carboxypeptidase [Nanoarchaeota archaeon]
MEIKKPMHLKEGDTIGIVSPSSTIKNFPRRLERGIKALEELGLKVKLGKNCRNSFGHNAGTSEERAEDINNFFKDKEIKAIICSTGGWNSNAVLPLLDYAMIKINSKIFCGFSDVTTLNLAIHKKTGLVTFNGPTVLPTFGEFGGPLKFSVRWFKKALFENEPIGTLKYPSEYTDELLWWETEDNRKRKMQSASKPKFVTKGKREGRLMGGNLNTLCILAGTEYFPDFTNTILFLEEEGESTSSVERRLYYLEQLGVLSKIEGLIFGRPYRFSTDSKDRTLYGILKEFGKKYRIPVVADVDIGHTAPMLTIPIGVKVRIDSESESIEIIESATV